MTIQTISLKAGDKVGVSRSGSWSNHYSIKTIKSVSKTGQVTLDNGDRFTADGRLMGGSKWHGTYLVTVEQVEESIRRDNARREQNNRVAAVETELANVVRNHKNGHGDVSSITSEEKQKLIDLINVM